MKTLQKHRSIALLSSVALATSAAVLGSVNPASASVLWNWSYSGGTAIGGSGTFTTNDLSGGSYLITAITGTAEGVAITSLLPPGSLGASDNLLFPNQPQLTVSGVSWLGADGNDWNLYFNDPTYSLFLFPLSVEFDELTFTATQVITPPPAAVPEPSSLLGLVGLGLALGGGAVRKMRK